MDDGSISVQAMMSRMGHASREGAKALRLSTPQQRTQALKAMAKAIREAGDDILAANQKDLESARTNGISGPMYERLELNPSRLAGIADSVDTVAGIADPLGTEIARWVRPNGLDIARVRTPIGTIGIIYESRPNVTADAAALCLRSGNAVILRGGSECLQSNRALHAAVVRGLEAAGLPGTCVQLVPTADRAAVGAILGGLDGAINLIIPRGGKNLVARVQAEARAPVLGHLEGLNHVFVHAAADPDKAVAISLNAKMRRVSVCGAAETLLVDRSIAPSLLPRLAQALTTAGCALRGDEASRVIVPAMEAASEADWTTEYLDAIISVALVDGVDGAAAHIARFGSGHTDAIITEDSAAAEDFISQVDSSIVLVNASTQYADGGEFGFGAEIGIATDRLHARGPVGAEQLTTFKYVVRGTGQTRP